MNSFNVYVILYFDKIINDFTSIFVFYSLGLDSASAYNVMHCVKRLATDMSVVCTIHQPSKEVFEVFDYMMLLKPGGYVTHIFVFV